MNERISANEPLSVAIAARALDGLSMRMAAIAHNIANAGSPRFQAVRVDFEAALREAAAAGRGSVEDLRIGFTADRAYAPDEDRRIDLMIADASQTAGRYAAIVDMVGRRLALHRSAIGGGR